jgi:type I restriction-modification system DNA methylase subunit
MARSENPLIGKKPFGDFNDAGRVVGRANRVVIERVIEVLGRTTISDPACGTGGFLICAYEWLVDESKGVFDWVDAKRIRTKTYFGQDLVARPRRLALMNLYLPNVEPHIYLGDTLYEPDRGERYDVVLTNPPFAPRVPTKLPNVTTSPLRLATSN